MAKLHHITFTGIDARTDISELQQIQREYPLAEFGVLASYHWYENGNRYLEPRRLAGQEWRGLNLALHVCGEAAHNAALGRYVSDTYHLVWGQLGLFRRIQLNIAGREDNPETVRHDSAKEIIIQQRGASDIGLYLRSVYADLNATFSVLLDASGGQGIDTPIEVSEDIRVPQGIRCKVGYAGGISPDNVAAKLTQLYEHPKVGDFWIDMESGVRTDDWFDTAKVRRVLELCQPIINKYEKKED